MPPTWLPLTLGAIAAILAGFHSLRLRRSGVNPWVLPTGDDAQGFLGRAFLGLAGLYGFVVLTWALAPGWALRSLGAVPLLRAPVFAWAGIGLIAAGVALIVVGQRELGGAWRVGIPGQNRPELVTTGVFGWSRNPVFLGIVLAAAGVALAIPHVLSAAALAGTYLALSVQIRLEEAYLQAWLGPAYADYAARVGRWLTWRGR